MNANKQAANHEISLLKPQAPSFHKQSSIMSGMGAFSNPQKVSVSLRTNDQRKVVEIPLDTQGDKISVHHNVTENGQQRIKT